MLFLKSIFETRTEFRTSLKFVEISLSLRMKNLAFNSIIDEDRRHEMGKTKNKILAGGLTYFMI